MRLDDVAAAIPSQTAAVAPEGPSEPSLAERIVSPLFDMVRRMKHGDDAGTS